MMRTLGLSSLALAAMMLLVVWPASSVAEPAPAPLASPTSVPPIVPPECVTKTRIGRIGTNWLPRAWVFIQNFEVGLKSCLLVYDRDDPNKVQNYRVFDDNCEVVGTVELVNGRARFDGSGHISCYVHLMNEVNALSGTVQITETARTSGFYMMARGTLSTTISPRGDAANLLVGYEPDLADEPATWLVTPVVSNTIPSAQIVAIYNKHIHTDANCTFPITGRELKVTVTKPTAKARMWWNTFERCRSAETPGVRIDHRGGNFVIGGSSGARSSGEPFNLRGILDEVVFDPFDGVDPPGFGAFLPILAYE